MEKARAVKSIGPKCAKNRGGEITVASGGVEEQLQTREDKKRFLVLGERGEGVGVCTKKCPCGLQEPRKAFFVS